MRLAVCCASSARLLPLSKAAPSPADKLTHPPGLAPLLRRPQHLPVPRLAHRVLLGGHTPVAQHARRACAVDCVHGAAGLLAVRQGLPPPLAGGCAQAVDLSGTSRGKRQGGWADIGLFTSYTPHLLSRHLLVLAGGQDASHATGHVYAWQASPQCGSAQGFCDALTSHCMMAVKARWSARRCAATLRHAWWRGQERGARH